MRVVLPAPLVLTTGTYYLQYSITAATTPFFPPVTTLHKFNTGNAKQYTNGVYAPLRQNTAAGPVPGAFQGVPFRLYGPAGALPGSIPSLGGGCSGPTLNVAGAPNVGGHVHASMTNITPNPAQFRNLIVGLSNPDIPLPGCSCVSLASLDVLAGFASDPANPARADQRLRGPAEHQLIAAPRGDRRDGATWSARTPARASARRRRA